jgi:hypothetical protein
VGWASCPPEINETTKIGYTISESEDKIIVKHKLELIWN